MKKLEKEGRNLAVKYIPDEKTPIHDFFINDSNHYSWNNKITYFNEQGTEAYIDLNLYRDTIEIFGAEGTKLPTIKILHHRKSLSSTMKIITYAKFIDDIIGSNLKQELKNEISNLGNFPRKFSSTRIRYRDYLIHKKVYKSYLIFYIIDDKEKRVYVLRVIKELMNWNRILRKKKVYHFAR